MSQAKNSNQANAPVCAAFVNELREVFGAVKVLYVTEGVVNLGEEMLGPFATCMVNDARNE